MRRDLNLFSLLSKGARRNLENYCTDALAWILQHDRTARSAFFDAFGTFLDGPTRDILRTLAAQDDLEIDTRRWFPVEGDDDLRRRICPDIWINHAQSNACMVVEVKAWARTTYRQASAEPQIENDDGDEAPAFVAQTKDYRRWLDDNRPEHAVLCALTTRDEPDLTESCHAALTWDQVVIALRMSEDRVTRQFCAYLEDEGMTTKDFSLSEDEVKSATNPVWEKIGILLDEVAQRLGEELSGEERSITLRGDYIGMSTDTAGQSVWTQEIALRRQGIRLQVTPYLRLEDSGVQVWIGVSGNVDLGGMPGLSETNKSELEEYGEMYLKIGYGRAVFEAGVTAEQAAILARMAVDQVRPIAARAFHSAFTDKS